MTNEKNIKLTVRELERPTRLDRAIGEMKPEWGRRQIQKLVNSRKVSVNGRLVWLCSWQVKNGDVLEVSNPPKPKPPGDSIFRDEWILSREDDLIAASKPTGMLSHATRKGGSGDFLGLAIERFGPLFLFHRLDRDTSGAVLFTRHGPINRYLDTAFKNGDVEKEYLAVVPSENGLESKGVIRLRLGPHPHHRDRMAVVEKGGQRAVTRYEILCEANGLQLVRLWPETGRTHQLRVHLQAMGATILGDRYYRGRRWKRLLLHARRIVLPDQDGFPRRVYVAPAPEDFLAGLPPTLQEFLKAMPEAD